MNKDIIEEIKKLNFEDSSDEDTNEKELPMNVVENKEKELTSKQRMGITMERLRNKRIGNKKRQKKLKFNVINETKLMMKYLETKEAKILNSELTSSDFKVHIINKFTKLHTEYSGIFDMIFEKKMNIDMLKFLCHQQDSLRNGKDQYSTDVDVGKALYDRYVKK